MALNLNKPDTGDVGWGADVNQNFTDIETELGTTATPTFEGLILDDGTGVSLRDSSGVLAVRNSGDTADADVKANTVEFGSTKHWGAKTTANEPTGANAGDTYFNTTIGELMYYDSTRSKWLSVATFFAGGGRSGTTSATTYYRRFNGMTMAGNYGDLCLKGTIVAMLASQSSSTASSTLELINNGSACGAELTIASTGTTYGIDQTKNVNIDAGVLSGRNKSGSGTTTNYQYTVIYRRRG